MANKKLQATATLFLNTADAKKDAERFVSDIKAKLQSIETAADKMNVFKDLVGYISQVDKALSALKAKNADAFNSMFNGIDSNLLKEIEGIFGTTKAQLESLEHLKTKVLNAKNNGATTDELKALEQQIRDLYSAANQMDKLKLSGRGSLETRIKNMENAISNFATIWDEVTQKISGGFGGGSGSGGGKPNPMVTLSEEATQQIKQLEQQVQKYEDLVGRLKTLSKSKIDFEVTRQSTGKFLDDFKRLNDEIKKFSGDTSSDDYQEKLQTYVKMSAQLLKLQPQFDKIKQGPISKIFDDYDDLYLDAEQAVSKYAGGSFAKDIIQSLKDQQESVKLIDSFDVTTKSGLSSALNKIKELGNIIDDSDANIDLVNSAADQIELLSNKIRELATSDDQLERVDDLLDFFDLGEDADGSGLQARLEELCNVLAIDIPESAAKAKQAMDDILEDSASGKDINRSIELLKQQLQIVHDAGKQIGDHELGFAVDVDGATYFVESCDNIVKASDEATVAVKALNENMSIMGHTHPNGGGQFSANDYISAINQRRAGIISPTMVMGDKFASLLSLADADDNVLTQIENVLKKHGKSGSDSVGPSIIREMQEVFSAHGMPDALQVIEVANGMDQLAEAVYHVGEATATSQTPLQKLQSLIKYYSGNKLFDGGLSAFSDSWNDFVTGVKTASEVFDDVMGKLGATDLEGNPFDTSSGQYQALGAALKLINNESKNIGSQVSDAQTALKEFFDLRDRISNLDSNYNANDVDIGRYTERLEVAKQKLDELGAQGLLTSEQLDQVSEAYSSAKWKLDLETNNYTGHGDGYYDYSYYDDYQDAKREVGDLKNELARAEERAQDAESESLRNQEAADRLLTENIELDIQNRVLQKQLDQRQVDEDDLEILRQENASLEEKLSLLQDIAQEYGNSITQRDRNRYEELSNKEMEDGLTSREEDRYFDLGEQISDADEKLVQFGETYDKIVLKLANGRKVEILPDDAGLRKFDKIANEYYEGEYNGWDIEEVVFVRKQENAAIEAGNQALEDQLNIQNQINTATKKTDLYDTSDGQMALFDNMSDGAQRAANEIEELDNALNQMYHLEGQMDMFDANGVTGEQHGDTLTLKEVDQLEALQQKLAEVRAAIDAKTQAFEEEYVTVDAAVSAEVASLQSLLEQLSSILTQANLVTESLAKIGTNSVELNVGDSEEQLASLLTGSNLAAEITQLEQLQTKVIEVKNAVLAKTKAFSDEGAVVGQSVGKEIAALMKLSGIVDEITPKVNALIVGLNGIDKQTNDGDTAEDTTTPKSPEAKFNAEKGRQIASLDAYRESLKDVDYLTDDLRASLQKLAEDLANISTPLGLEAFKQDLAEIKKEIAAEKSAFERVNFGYVNSEQTKLKTAFNKLTDEQKLDVQVDYENAIAELEHYKISVREGKEVELAAIQEITAALKQKMTAYHDANKEAERAQRAAKKNTNFGSTAEINATAKMNSLKELAKSGQFSNSSVVQQELAQLEAAFERLINKKNELAAQDVISPEDKAEFKQLTKEYNDYAAALEKTLKNSLNASNNRANSYRHMLGADFTDNAPGREAALNSFIQSIDGVDEATVRFKNNFNECMFVVRNGDGTFTNMSATFTAARNEIVAIAGETGRATTALASFINEVKGKFKSIGAYLTASVSIYEVWSVIRQGVTYVKEIDTALTELKKVTDATDASYDNFLQDMARTGSVIGATVTDLTTMASEWARLGYSMQEAGKLAESTAILLNVSEFESATDASEALISTMQAFQYTADESRHVVDILNEVGNNYAVSSDGIATALQDSASALMEAGNNLEQSVALVAAANKVVNFVPRCHSNMAA